MREIYFVLRVVMGDDGKLVIVVVSASNEDDGHLVAYEKAREMPSTLGMLYAYWECVDGATTILEQTKTGELAAHLKSRHGEFGSAIRDCITAIVSAFVMGGDESIIGKRFTLEEKIDD